MKILDIPDFKCVLKYCHYSTFLYLFLFLVDAKFVLHQKKLIVLLENITQVWKDAEWYKVGFEYDIEANKENYTVSTTRHKT